MGSGTRVQLTKMAAKWRKILSMYTISSPEFSDEEGSMLRHSTLTCILVSVRIKESNPYLLAVLNFFWSMNPLFSFAVLIMSTVEY